ncbi:MAG TPA: 30S ribosomal protein S17, partial [Leucothrix sp.]|nr:30S ribosomal protein S17 [Leucothrix sp.]
MLDNTAKLERSITGEVVSNKMDKTIVVTGERKVK